MNTLNHGLQEGAGTGNIDIWEANKQHRQEHPKATGLINKNNHSAPAFYISLRFFVVLCKTRKRIGQIQLFIVENASVRC